MIKKFRIFESIVDEMDYIVSKAGDIGPENLTQAEEDMMKIFRGDITDSKEEVIIWIKYLVGKHGGRISSADLHLDASIYYGEYVIEEDAYGELLILQLIECYCHNNVEIIEYIDGSASEFATYTLSYKSLDIETLHKIKDSITENLELIQDMIDD